MRARLATYAALGFVLFGCAARLSRAPHPVTASHPASSDSLKLLLVGPADDFVSALEAKSALPCDSLPFPVYSLSRSLSSTACALAIRARRLVVAGAARHLGVEPSDSARLTVAVVDHTVISTLRGAVVDRYDGVDLGIDGLAFAVSIQWRPGGLQSISKTEPLTPWTKAR